MPGGKFLPVNAYVKKEEISQIDNLTLYHMELEKQTKPRVVRRKEIIKVRAEISKIENKKSH